MLSKTIECLSTILVAHKGGLPLFHLLLGAVSGSLPLFLAGYDPFWGAPLFISDEITE